MKKKLQIILSICLCSIVFFSCKKVADFLDKPPGIDVDENLIFSAQVQTERYMATLYQYGTFAPYPLRPADAGFSGLPASFGAFNGNMNSATIGITDEGEQSESFSIAQDWNNAAVTPLNIVSREDERYFLRWLAIRVANIILERADGIPDANNDYKKMIKGEALFIRALSNFETFKRYGGFPIVNKRIITIEDSKIARSSVADCVAAIVKDCDDAIALLPVVQTSNFTGRAHIGAALALKARTLLYAASPLFNTATPYLSLGNAEDDKLLCFGNADNNRWKLAADAAKAVLDWSAANGFALIDVPANRIPVFGLGGIVNGNYRTSWQQPDNQEMIFSCKLYGAPKSNGSFPWQFFLPRSNYVPNGLGFWTPPSPTFNFVRKYERRDGTTQTWDLVNGGNDLLAKYDQLDARFSQTICYTGARLHANVTRTPIYQGTTSDKTAAKGGFWMLKWIPDAIPTLPQIANAPIFRVNEVLLSYAEALNEFSGPTPEAYAAVNAVRTRSGMPNLPPGLSKDQFRTRVRNERDIEMAFENYRLWDIRRWMIAEQDGVMQGNMLGLEITRLNNTLPFPTAFSYKSFVFETRTFQKRMYLHPFDNNEVLKGNLKQNPGW